MNEKKTNYKLLSKFYHTIGMLFIAVTSLSSFFVYQVMTNFNEFQKDVEQFIVVSPETAKLNSVIAFPALIGLVVYLFIALRKNREFFKNNLSFSLLISIAIFYFFYSIVEITLVTLVGAFTGSIFDDFIFSPLSKNALYKAEEQQDINREYEKEKRRIKARVQAREELDGSV
jgi:hypothetical protein